MLNRLKLWAIGGLIRVGLLQRVLDALTNRRLAKERRTQRRRLRRLSAADRRFARDDQAYEAVVDEDYAVVARRVARCAVVDVIRANREIVCSSLAADGVAHTVLPLDSNNRARVGVAAADRHAVVASLSRHAPAGTHVYLDLRGVKRRRRVTRLDRRPPHAASAEAAQVWRIYEPVVAGGMVFGHIHGCEIEFWNESEDGQQLMSARWNRAATRIDNESFGAAQADLPGGTVAVTPGTIELDYVEDVSFPVDLVYTWVDGNDPAWLESRAAVFGELDFGAVNEEAANDARYQSFDELKYSLRSAEMYADFARHIYIVTDRQKPDWLVDDHPRLTVVDHRDIFGPRHRLPTFNSHAIESRLHHIPGLAEHYVYLNDDFFFARRLTADAFFHGNGLAKSFPSRALVPLGDPTTDTKPADAAAMNGRALVAQKFGVLVSRKYKHAPYPQRRDVHLDIERLFPDDVEQTSSSRVRSPTDLALASSLHHHVAYATGRGVGARIRSAYVGTAYGNLRGRLHTLQRRSNLDVFCVNDEGVGSDAFETTRAELAAFFERRFPFPSTFERATGSDAGQSLRRT